MPHIAQIPAITSTSIESKRRLPVTALIDYLLDHQMSPSVVTFLLVFVALVFFVVLCKHVVGVEFFGMSYALRGVLVLTFFGPAQTILFFLCGYLAYRLVQTSTKKLYLLYHAKQ